MNNSKRFQNKAVKKKPASFEMPENRHLFLFMLLLLFTIGIAYFDAANPATGYMIKAQGAGSRLLPRILLVLNLMIMGYYTLLVQFSLSSKSPFIFKTALLVFFVFILLYNLVGFDYYWLSRVAYTLLVFFPFYYAGYKGFLSEKAFYFFGVGLLVVYLYGFYVGFTLRGELNQEIYDIADNTGYSLLSVFIYFVLKPSKSFNIYLLAFIFIAVLFSFKRGAILSAGVAFTAFTFYNFRNIKKSKTLILPIIIGVLLVGFVAIKYSDMILYRFLSDSGESMGSGRETMFAMIYSAWIGSDAIGILFGRGFFTVMDTLGGHFAHSDWMELMHDHGLIGMALYAMLIGSFVMSRKHLARDMMPAYIAIITVWLLKSIFSGVYMDRGFSLFFACIGLLLGTFHRQIETTGGNPSSQPNKHPYDPRRLHRIAP
jgi:hypothetical protein